MLSSKLSGGGGADQEGQPRKGGRDRHRKRFFDSVRAEKSLLEKKMKLESKKNQDKKSSTSKPKKTVFKIDQKARNAAISQAKVLKGLSGETSMHTSTPKSDGISHLDMSEKPSVISNVSSNHKKLKQKKKEKHTQEVKEQKKKEDKESSWLDCSTEGEISGSDKEMDYDNTDEGSDDREENGTAEDHGKGEKNGGREERGVREDNGKGEENGEVEKNGEGDENEEVDTNSEGDEYGEGVKNGKGDENEVHEKDPSDSSDSSSDSESDDADDDPRKPPKLTKRQLLAQLRFSKDDPGVKELVKDSGIFVLEDALDDLRERRNLRHTVIARDLLEMVFKTEALVRCSLQGKGQRGPLGRTERPRPGLYKVGVEAVLKKALHLVKELKLQREKETDVKKQMSTKISELRSHLKIEEEAKAARLARKQKKEEERAARKAAKKAAKQAAKKSI